MKIQVLGSGCTKCKMLEDRIRRIVAKHQLDVEIEKVSDLKEIMKYGIMVTPGLVIDDVVKSTGFIPEDDQLLSWMKGTK